MPHCPHCQTSSISISQKYLMGPAKPTTCKSCKQKVKLSLLAIPCYLPFLLAVSISIFLESMAWKLSICALAFIGLSIIHMILPLRKG